MCGGNKVMRILAVTGGIGSGKSEVCRILAENGLELQYEADSRAKALYVESPDLLDAMEEALGCSLRGEDGRFLPNRLSQVIFNDPESLAKVEQLLFPQMLKDFSDRMSGAGKDAVVVFESATFLEKPAFDGFADMVLLVDAPFQLRLERACSRDGVSAEAVLARMQCQKLMNFLSDGGTDPRIDYVIENVGSREELQQKVLEFLSCLQGQKNR